MTEIVIGLADMSSNCMLCTGGRRMRIRITPPGTDIGGFASWVDCPLCVGAASLVDWLAVYGETPEVSA